MLELALLIQHFSIEIILKRAYNYIIMRDLVVDKKYDNKKLSKLLLDTFPALKYGIFVKALKKKDILINEKRVSKDCIVYENDKVRVYIVDDLLYKKYDIPVIYEDDNIIIFNKPKDLEVTGIDSLTTYVNENYSPKFMPCHRLDRNTSGLIIFSKSDEVNNILMEKFKNHEIEKRYLAKVIGIPIKKKDTLVHYLFKDNKKSMVYISDKPKTGYRKIITSYKVISSNQKENTSILDINLETGRTHQIRAHLAYIGHPIIGDGKYGNNQINKKFNQKTQLLCSYYIKFNFNSDAGVLNYLNGKEVKLDDINFI